MKLLNFNQFITEKLLTPADADTYAADLGLTIKKYKHHKNSELTSITELPNKATEETLVISSKIIEIAAEIKRELATHDITFYISAGNDKAHGHKASDHPKGKAIDFVLNNVTRAKINKTEEVLKTFVTKYYESYKFSFLNEYDYPSKGSSGPHFHIAIKTGDDLPKLTINTTNHTDSANTSMRSAGGMSTNALILQFVWDNTLPVATKISKLAQLSTSASKYLNINDTRQVVTVQQALHALKYLDDSNINGYFDTATKQGIMKYQRDLNLKVDGIVGPQTLTSLNQEVSKVNI